MQVHELISSIFNFYEIYRKVMCKIVIRLANLTFKNISILVNSLDLNIWCHMLTYLVAHILFQALVVLIAADV